MREVAATIRTKQRNAWNMDEAKELKRRERFDFINEFRFGQNPKLEQSLDTFNQNFLGKRPHNSA